MRKFTIFLAAMLFFGLQVAYAQTTITGTVTNADDGTAIPGVTVIVKGTSVGTTTDLDGKYELTAPEGATTLIFSYVGMVTQEIEIGGRTVINVQLQPGLEELEEVVVTALGVTREKKALGYAVQDVGSEELEKARNMNIINALSGKVSGVQIASSSGAMGGSSRILIRGASSVNGENQPLFIVDGIPFDNSNFTSVGQARGAGGFDYGNMANDINPDDIESVSILKGPTAAALYGSRAANGVILITTKTGKARAIDGKKGIGVSVSSGLTFERVAILPNYQNEYGGGYGFETLWYNYNDNYQNPIAFPNRTSGLYQGTNPDGDSDSYDLLPHYAVDESWGPKLNGQMVRPWYSYSDAFPEAYGKNFPWEAHPDNVRDFFRTGQTWTNNIALTGGTEKAFFRLSYTNIHQFGIWPKSEIKKNSINFSGSTKLGDKLTAFTVINYVQSKAIGRPGTGYDGDNMMQEFNQWSHRNWDQEAMKKYWINPDGSQNTWNRTSWDNPFPKYTDNPYWTRYKNYENDQRDRFYGNIGVTYEFTDWLKITGKINKDFYTDRREERRAVGSNETPRYQEGIRQLSETNMEFLLQFNKYLTEDLSLAANLGANQMTRIYHRNVDATQGGLSIPDFYNLANSKDVASLDDYRSKKQINSIYGSASLGYLSMIYLDLTLRNDWSSTLPEDNNSYLYPSVTASWIFTELDVLNKIDWFSFGKIRLGWAQVGNDTDPYQLYSTYAARDNFGGYPSYTVPNALNNADLKPERTSSWEVGGDFKFLNNRVGVDVTYYSMETVDQIIDVDISASSGFRSQIINAGKMTNKGWEILLTGTPVKMKNFTWDITVNWSQNKNELVELMEGIDNYRLVNAPFSVSVNATVGQPYGTLLGRDYVYKDGERFVNANGMYERSSEVVPLGNVMPNYTGGVNNSLTWKNINLSFLFDFRNGGQIFSTSYMFGMYSGMLEETIENNIREDGIILEGVMEDPDNPGSYITNTQVCSAELYGLNHYFVAAMDVFDCDYIKLRELSLSYTLPDNLLKKVPFENVRIAFIARNLWTFGTAIKHFDPEQATNSGNIQGIEGAQLPSTRTWGFNLSFNL